MGKSRVTSKNQTTVPKDVRERLGIHVSDVLVWETRDGLAEVYPASHRFLERRGTIRVSRGDVQRDVRAARRTRGITP